MSEYDKIFWLILFVNFIGICLTLSTLWVYSHSIGLLAQAITKLKEKIEHLRLNSQN